MTKRRKKRNVSLAIKLKFVKKFSSVKSRKSYKNAGAYKSAITRKYKELQKYKRLKFIKVNKEKIKKWSKGGGAHTDKGIFVTLPRSPISDKIFKGVRSHVRNDGIVRQSVGKRTEYIFPIDAVEAAALVGDALAFIGALKKKYASIFKRHAKDKMYVRLIFPKGEADEMKLDDLEYYLSHLPDIISTRTGRVRKTSNKRRQEMSLMLTAVKVIFFKRGKGDE